MTVAEQIRSDYFEWMYNLMCEGRCGGTIAYRELFHFLHDAEFTFFVPHDENRASDGVDLRYHFCVNHDCEDLEYCLDGPCSVLEMMVALAIRCEHIMSDPAKGDRTAQWFWNMVNNLDLGGMYDSNFNEWRVNDSISRFLDREYEPNGSGGLFTIKNWDRDARDAEIWHQLMAYLGDIS